MRKASRLSALVAGGLAAALLAACSSYPPAPVYSTAPAVTYPAAGSEYGRVVNVEYMPVGTIAPANHSILGAIVGGVAGAALGNQIGHGTGRAAATVLGGVAGAAIGDQVGRNAQGATTSPGYRITIQTDRGAMRVYEVPATGDLRVGDRVRVDNGVIYRV